MPAQAIPVPSKPRHSSGRRNQDNLGVFNPLKRTKCSSCSKVFKRSEHCARHELSHTNERPFTCRFCYKGYGRKDLVKRHERTIHADLYNVFVNESSSRHEALTGESGAARLQACTVYQPCENPDAVEFGHLNVLDGETHVVRGELSPTLRRATSSGNLNTNTANLTIPLSLAQSMASISPPDTTTNANTDAATIHPRILRSSGQSSEQSEFSISGFLVASPFPASLTLDHYDNVFETGQQHSKYQMSSFEGQLMQSVQNDQSISIPALSSISPGKSTDLYHPSHLMDLDSIMGGASSEFPLYHAAQQPDLAFETSGPMRDVLATRQASALALQITTDAIPSGQLLDSASDEAIETPGRTRLPMILKEKPENPTRLFIDDAAFQALYADVSQRLGNAEVDLPFKTRRELQHLLKGYVDCFHRHLPIVHLPTFEVSQTPSPLILAMCCIGALYRLERRKAQDIYSVAAIISETKCSEYSPAFPLTSRPMFLHHHGRHQAVSPKPLWLMQARTLLLLYAALGSDGAIMQAELERMAVFMTDYRARRSALNNRSCQYQDLQWREWIEIEATKRLLAAMFISSSLLVLVYDFPPGFGVTQDLEFELLEEEKLWSAPTAEEWRALRGFGSPVPRRTVRGVMADMLAGKTIDNSDSSLYCVSGFTALVAIHGLNMYAWSLRQFSEVLISPSSEHSGVSSGALITNALIPLARCREVLQIARPEDVESLWNNPEGPLLLSCEAMLRVAYTRLFLSASLPEGLVLLLNQSDDNPELLIDFVAAPQERSPLITKVMSSMYDAFSVPSKAGYLLVQKTAAISWSIEHAVANWGCVLLLSKWLHCLDMQPDEVVFTAAEIDLVTQVKTALDGMNMECDEMRSLAAAVVSSWAPLMTDVWVWGITTRMGAILVDLAQAYEESSKSANRNRLMI